MILLLILTIPGTGFSDSLRDALDQKNKAYNDYYKGYKALGENPSAAQLSELRSKTIVAAQTNLAKELNQVVHDREAEIRQTIYDAIKKQVPEAAAAKWITDPMSAFKSMAKKLTGSGDSSSSATSRGPASSDSPNAASRNVVPPYAPPPPGGPFNEGPVIDGSQFPKELFFPGSKK